MHRGIATFTLDYGHCPRWLFQRMVNLGREMVRVIVSEYGSHEFVRRVADPVWFQSLGTVLAFDWNASGLTTTLTAALKEAIRGQEKDLGIFICGGKGKTSRKTPEQIQNWGKQLCLSPGNIKNLQYNSKMSAKVDSSLIQDGYQLYHHTFFFSRNGAWSVVQQGMDQENRTARRYHWYSKNIKNLVVEPHSGIITQRLDQKKDVLNMTDKSSNKNRQLSLQLARDGKNTLIKDLQLLDKHSSELLAMRRFKINNEKITFLKLAGREFKAHRVMQENFSGSGYLKKIFSKLYNEKPKSYESLVAAKGVGPKTIRALSLVSEVIYGARASYKDPARYSFAHGGKDGTPFFVDRSTYDRTINILAEIVGKTRLPAKEKDSAIKRLTGRSPHNKGWQVKVDERGRLLI